MTGKILIFVIAAGLWLNPVIGSNVEVLWLGHATVRFTSVEGRVIVVDPFLKKNPKTPAEYRDLKALGKVDLILVTHGHGDHMRDLVELAALTGAQVVAPYSFALNMISLGMVPGDKMIGMNKGGSVSPLGQGIKVHMVPAEHSSGVDFKLPGLELETEALRMRGGGAAVGYVVEFENGFKVYHSGDTGVFGDMALIREFFAPDLAMVCIGGHFTMDPVGAAYAVKNLLKPKMVIPIHYGTFPVVNRTPAEFKAALGDAPVEVIVAEPGQKLTF